jgi:hypothetical protein
MTDDLDAKWLGVMIEVDDPFIGKHSVPGWECRTCGQRYGSQGYPPKRCKCGAEWNKPEEPTDD